MKSPQFSYNRLKGADPVAGVEMASTGEVACFGSDLAEAFYASWLATDQHINDKTMFLSLPDEQKYKFVEEAATLVAQGWHIYSTIGTHLFLKQHNVKTTPLRKVSDRKEPSVGTAIAQQKIALMINVPSTAEETSDAYIIRRLAIDNHIPLLTNAETGRLLMRCLGENDVLAREPKSWQEYVGVG